MARPINSIPALGSDITKKAVQGALKAPLAAIPNVSGVGETDLTVNSILAALRTLGLINP